MTSERSVETWVRRLLPSGFVVTAQPRDLADLYAEGGLIPELKVLCVRTGRYVFIEVKRQGPAGNAEERLYKLFTPRFVQVVEARCRLPYHPFVAVLCDDLAKLRRYQVRFEAHLVAGTYLRWANYEPVLLAAFLDELRERWLEPSELGPRTLPACSDLVPTYATTAATPGAARLEVASQRAATVAGQLFDAGSWNAGS